MLQSGLQGPPLFMVHLVDGQLMRYRELVARLGADLPIHGFELASDPGRPPVLTTFEELAAKYVRLMRVKQPTGPYFLCGYCWAGELTFEMARQLVAAGQEVAFLALIDSRCRNVGTRPYHRRLASRARKWWKLFTQNMRRLAALEHRAIPAFLQMRAENITMRLFGVKAYRWSLQLGRPVLPLTATFPSAGAGSPVLSTFTVPWLHHALQSPFARLPAPPRAPWVGPGWPGVGSRYTKCPGSI